MHLPVTWPLIVAAVVAAERPPETSARQITSTSLQERYSHDKREATDMIPTVTLGPESSYIYSIVRLFNLSTAAVLIKTSSQQMIHRLPLIVLPWCQTVRAALMG